MKTVRAVFSVQSFNRPTFNIQICNAQGKSVTCMCSRIFRLVIDRLRHTVLYRCCAGPMTRRTARCVSCRLVLAPIAFTTQERSHINSVHLNVEKRSHDVPQSLFPFRSSRGIDEEAVPGELGMESEVVSQPVAVWPHRYYPCSRRHRSAAFEQGGNASMVLEHDYNYVRLCLTPRFGFNIVPINDSRI